MDATPLQTKSQDQPCPLCGTVTEPELDGQHIYYECQSDDCETVGYTWGYQMVQVPDAANDCAIGVPESVRRAASAPVESVIAAEAARQPVPISIGRRPE